LEGTTDPVLVGIHLSTPDLTAGSLELGPGQRSDALVRGGDEAGYVLSGRLHLFLPDGPDPEGPANAWHEIEAGDAWFVPEGVPHRYFNMTDEPVRAIFGVAPRYLPADGCRYRPRGRHRRDEGRARPGGSPWHGDRGAETREPGIRDHASPPRSGRTSGAP